ncbi:heavy-metal-associated domain-containing protein [Candidatus Sumerlaeota bacterium]|nr:heavy-metal-associated domain-containing protein [Candidatus Sumerlaeota bacterium]
MKETVIRIEGMTCEGCVRSVTKALEQVDGVSRVQVSLERASATVAYQEENTSMEALQAAIRLAGFETP